MATGRGHDGDNVPGAVGAAGGQAGNALSPGAGDSRQGVG